MANGTVQWFNAAKGYGVVELPNGTTAFVHRSVIPGDGYVYLVKGEPVQVEVGPGIGDRLNVTSMNFLPSRRMGQVKSFDKGFGYIEDDADHAEYFFHHTNVLRSYGWVDMEVGEPVLFYKVEGQDGRTQAKYVKKADPRSPFERFSSIPEDTYANLAALAEPEDWSLSHDDSEVGEPRNELRLLRNYIKHTFLRLADEDKIATGSNQDGDTVAAFNTGLVTPRQQEIYALFRKQAPGALTEWHFLDWVRDSDGRVGGVFDPRPRLAQYWTDARELFFDPSLPVILDAQHFVDDNLDRYPEMFQQNSALAVAATNAAKDLAIARAKRNYKTAVPMYHKGEIELLLPLSLDGTGAAQLALLIRKVGSEYLGETVLTLAQALNNARLVARPDRDWLKV